MSFWEEVSGILVIFVGFIAAAIFIGAVLFSQVEILRQALVFAIR